MLSINFYNVDEEVEVGALFAELDVNSEDETQDFFIENQFNIEVLSLDSYYSIEGFRLTKTEKLVKFIVDGFELEASPEHVVLTDKGWLKICDIDAFSPANEIAFFTFALPFKYPKTARSAVLNVAKFCFITAVNAQIERLVFNLSSTNGLICKPFNTA